MPCQRKLFLASTVCALSIPFAQQAFALTPEEISQEVSQVDSVSEVAPQQSTQSMRSLDAVTVTATRQEEHVLEVPASINIVTREKMDNYVVNSMADLVRYEPGIQANKTTSGTDPFSNFQGFTIRGVGGNRVQIQVDGTRVIESIQSGNRDFVDSSMMKSVEIMRGPGSVLWGADALSGIVYYKSLDPEDILKARNLGARVSAGYDSLNQSYTISGLAAKQVSPEVQVLIGYTHRQYHEAKLKNARRDGGLWGCSRIGIGCNELNPLSGNVNNVMGKLVWTPSAYHIVKFVGESYKSDSDVEQLFDKHQTSLGFLNSGNYLRNQDQTRWRLGVEHDWVVDAGWLDSVKWKLSYSPQKRNLTDFREQTRVATGAIVLTDQITNYSEDFLQADIQLTSNLTFGSSEHLLTYGLQADQTKTDYYRESTTTDKGTGILTTTYGGGTNFSKAKTTRFDLFAQDEIYFLDEQLAVIPGLRWANYKITPHPDKNYNVISGKEPRELSSHKLIPQVSFVVTPSDQYMLYARYAEGFKMPTAEQLFTSFSSATSNIIPNPDLKPEEVKSFEVGMKGEIQKGWLSTSIFYNDYTNFIKSLQRVSGSTMDYTSLNISKVKIWGIEVGGGWKLNENWQLSANASYQHGKERNQGSNTYTPYSGLSPLTGVVGVKWFSPERTWDVELLGSFARRVTRVKDDTYYKPAGYAVFDSYLNWQIKKGVRASFSVRNIFDKRYFTERASTLAISPGVAEARTNPLELYTGAGRSFAFNVILDF